MEKVNKKSIEANDHADTKRTFAKFGDGPWYAILPGMAELLRKAGAEISVVADSQGLEGTRQ